MAQKDPTPNEKLFKLLTEEGLYTKTYKDFQAQFSTEDKVAKLHQLLTEEGLYTKPINEFNTRFFPELGKPSEVSGQGSADTSVTSGQQSSSSAGPSSDEPVRYAEVTIEGAPIEDDEGSTWRDIGLSLQMFPEIFNQLVYSIPEYLYDLASEVPNILADAVQNNAGEDILGFIRTPTYQQALSGMTLYTEEGEESALNYINPLYAVNAVVKNAKQRQEYLGSQMQQYEQGVFDSIMSGNFRDAGAQTVTGIIQSLPSMAAMAVTGGASRLGQLSTVSRTALNALPFAASNYQEIQENENLSQGAKLVVSGLHGLGEILTEQSFGTGRLINDIVSGKINKRQFSEFVEGYIDKLLTSNGIPAIMFRGGVSEATTRAWNNVVAKYSGEDPDRDLNEGIMDDFIIGLASDGAFGTTNRVARYILGSDTKNLYESTLNDINVLKEDLDNPTVPDSQKEIIQREVENKANKMGEVIQESKDVLDKLNPQQREQLEQELDRREEVEGVIQDPSISDETKTIFEGELGEINSRIDDITQEAATTKALEGDPDLANIDPTIQAARKGDKQAQQRLEEYGLEWEQTTTYRFVGQSEVDVLLANERVNSKRGHADGGIDVTTSPKVTTAASNEYRVTFKESFDVNNGLGKVRAKNDELGDHNLEPGRGYDINDVAKIERLDENGNVVETVYNANEQQPTDVSKVEKVETVYHHTKVKPENFNFDNFKKGANNINQYGDGLNASTATNDMLKSRYGNPIKGEVRSTDFVKIDSNKTGAEVAEELKKQGYKLSENHSDLDEPLNESPGQAKDLFDDFQKSNPDVKGVKVYNHIITGKTVDPFYVIYDNKSFYGEGSLKSKPNIKEEAPIVKDNNNQLSLNTPTEAQTSTPVIKTEAEAQAGEYFTRDIGGEQTVYRRNEDGTASIVPDSEAQNILSRQTEAGGTSLQGSQQGGLSQNNAPATQDFFTAVVEGTDPRFIPIKPYETEGAYSPEQAKVAEAMEPKFGNFDTHIATSIPQYRETQVKKAAGIIAVLEGREDARVFDIGGSEGNMVKTITELTGVETYNLEPNEAMASSHEATPVEGSTVIREAFYEGFDGHEAHVPTEKYDVVNESMVFQFITPERKQFIDHVADNYLKEDGLFISEEKLKTNRDLYIENEAQKDREHKSKYYTPEQLKLKSDQVLMGMDENQADVRDYIEALKGRFKHVGLYWNSGNFYGVAASNSKQTFDTFMASVGDTQTQYTKVTLGEVTDPSTIPSSSQSTQELSAPTGTQTETVSTVLQEAGATPQESASFLEDLRTDEGRARRKAQALADFKKALGRTANVGISGDALAKALEYAIVSIIDGSVKSARALSQALGISQEQGQQIYDRAFQATQAMRDAVVTPPRRTVKAQVREATQGGITGTETVVVNSKKALKDQLRMAEVNARAGAAIGALNQKQAQKKHRDNVRNYKKVVRDYINSFKNTDLFKGVKIPADIVPRLTSKLSRIDETSPNAVTHIMNFSEYLEKLVDDINYDGKAQKAREESKRIRGEAKRLDKQRDLQGALQRLAALGATPSRLADIDGYLELAGRAIDRQGTTAATVMDINAFVNTQEKAYEAEQVRKQEAVNAVRREEALAHMQKIMDAEGIEGSAVDYYDESVLEYRPEGVPSDLPTPPETSKAKETLERVIAFNRKGLPRSIEGLSPYEANALEALINTPLEPLDTKALRALNTAITNAVVNGDLLSGTSEIVGRYRANRDAESWLDEFSAKKKHIVQGTSERATSLLPSRMKLDTNQIFKAVAGAAREMGEMLHSYVMGEINQGYTEAKQIVDKEVKKALDIYDKNKMKTRDAYKVGTALYLMNYETDGMWDSPQQAFDLKVNMIVQSRDALTDVLNRRDETLDDIDRRRYKRDERQLGILLKELDAIKTPEQFQETFLNAKQRVLYDHILEAWKSQKEATRDLYQKMGVKFTESELFAPTSFNNIIVSGISADQNIGIDSYHRPGGIDNVGKHVAERKGVTTLPTTKAEDGTIITRYLSLNAITNFDREFSRRMVDMKTIDGRIKAKYILSNADVRDALDAGGKLDNHESIVWKVTANIRDLNGISGFINDYDYGLDKITNVASRYFYRSSVGSLTQTVNQSVTNIPSIAANTSWGAWAQSSALMANNVYNNVMGNTSDRLVTDLINAAGASAYNRLASDMDQRMRSRLQGLDNEFENSFIKGLQKVDEAIGNITYLGLSGGDNFNTKNSWLAGYINSLKQQGVIKRYKDFNLEMLRKHIANPNRRAAEMADNVASAVNATMRQASRAESVKVKSRSQRVLNFMMGYLLKTFATSQNMEARLALNNIKRGDYTSKDYKILGGYLSNVFILSTLAREMWTAVFQGVGGLLAGAFFDEDELKKAEERRLERLGLTKEEEDRIRTQRRLIGRLAQGVGDVAFGSKPIIVESLGMLAIDKVYANMIVPYFDKGSTPQDRARMPIPASLFYTSEDNVFGVGGLDNINQVWTNIEKIATGSVPRDEEAIRSLQTMRGITAFLSTGVLGADMKRLSQQTLIPMERALKDGYFQMPDSYGVIKKAVNKYGLKPIPPFNKKIIYAEDSNNVIHAIPLSESDIDKINIEIGKRMVEMLPKEGYGQSLSNFNKNKLSIDDINRHMSDMKYNAEYDVILKLYGMHLSTPSAYEAQEEDNK